MKSRCMGEDMVTGQQGKAVVWVLLGQHQVSAGLTHLPAAYILLSAVPLISGGHILTDQVSQDQVPCLCSLDGHER